jgi:hypothetical protein
MAITLTFAFAVAASPFVASAQSTEPSSRSSRATRRESPLAPAIAELSKEVAEHVRTGDAPKRLASDYFNEHPLPDVTAEQVITAIAQVPRNSDPRVQAYVQWQLLSALPETLDGRSASALLKLYQSAPQPIMRPGLELQEQQRLKRIAAQAGQESESELSTQFTKAVDEVAAKNRFILNNRDELFARLPKTYDTLAAGFDDAMVRLETGADAEEHAEVVVEAVRAWAGEKRNYAELQAMNRLVLKVKNKQGPEYFEQPEWKAQYRRLEWSKRRPSLNYGHQLDELADELYKQSKENKPYMKPMS